MLSPVRNPRIRYHAPKPMRHTCIFLIASVAATLFASAEAFDHSATIKALRDSDARAGGALYALNCAACHGKDGDLALNPLARRFAKDELKFGADPYSLWKTISYGNGLMFRWDAVLSEKERYQIVHHLRERIIREKNPKQYFRPDEKYFADLNVRAARDAEEQAKNAQKVTAAAGMIDGTNGKSMNYGPFLQHAVAYSKIEDINAEHIENTTEKAMVIRLSDDTAICYDTARLSISGVWKMQDGKLADTTKTHHTSYKGSLPLRPSGEVTYQTIDEPGWRDGDIKFNGHYVHGDRVVLSYRVGDREILESPMPAPANDLPSRKFQFGAGKVSPEFLVAKTANENEFISWKSTDNGASSGGTVDRIAGGIRSWIRVRPSEQTATFTLASAIRSGILASAIRDENPLAEIPEENLSLLTKGGKRNWPQAAQTAVARGENVEGYALDILTAPLANPYGSWMRLTALDFFSDGRIAVSTLSGDVWIVSWTTENPDALTWSRFAAGLYEPLGLKIVDDKIYVRGRDRITRLHDLNQDGEADFYESFFEDPHEIGASYHAFKYDLQTDRDGNFYYTQSGYKSPLTGAVVRVDRYGKSSTFIGTDLRNPNGLGAGGPDDWITVADNPSGKSIYNGFTIAREGALYGYEKQRNLPMLVVLPARVDSSSSSQCWSDPERWGPLGGSIIHGSYSLSKVFYCLTQDIGEFPNGFAMRLPFELKSAPMRARVSPTDGQIYIAAQRGWDSIAQLDGAIYRIRKTGKPSHLVSGAAATASGIRLSFPCELDANSVIAENFLTTRETDNKNGAAPEPQAVGKVTLTDSRTIEIEIPGIEKETLEHRTTTDPQTGGVSVSVNPAISLSIKLKAADGTAIEQTIHATINSLP